MAESLRELMNEIAPVARRGLADEVLDCLREALVRGYFNPGQHLSEPALAKEFDVSRGPVREALVELDREGLVQIQRHKGATVTRLSRKDIEEIYGLRVALERLAMQRAVKAGTAEDFIALDSIVVKLEEAVQSNATWQAVDLDVAFHDLIYQAARHSRLYTCWSNLRSQMRAFLLSRIEVNNDYLDLVITEHSALRDVLKARDENRAVELMEEHLRGAYERLVRRSTEYEPQTR
jgi:DNA-binding GntR family transcriptional regulator